LALGVAAGEDLIIRDRVMGEPDTGRPVQLATSYIPATLADELPVLAQPDTGPGGIYDRMEEAGHGPIQWREAISARAPAPEEAQILRIPAGVPILRIVRSAASPAGRVLEVNDTRMSADDWEISYSIQRHASARRQ
jgi:GntR family transcriptional regulator